MKTGFLVAVAIATVCAGSPASAGLVTFDSSASASAGPLGDGATYAEAGLTFTSSLDDPNALYHWGTTQPQNADPDGATLFQNYLAEWGVDPRTGGGTFSLNSFDLADSYDEGASGPVRFHWVRAAGGGGQTTLSTDGLEGLQTFNVNLTGLSFFRLGAESVASFQMDNVRFRLDGVGVPEPSTWALMIAGFGGTGAMLRRRRTAPG